MAMEDKDAAIAAIRTCKTRETLDKMLKKFEVTDGQETVDYLNECMYNPQTFFSSEPITIEEEAEFTKQVFLTGTWRLNEYYDRLGIGTIAAHA